jgi:hypothetical protein
VLLLEGPRIQEVLQSAEIRLYNSPRCYNYGIILAVKYEELLTPGILRTMSRPNSKTHLRSLTWQGIKLGRRGESRETICNTRGGGSQGNRI